LTVIKEINLLEFLELARMHLALILPTKLTVILMAQEQMIVKKIQLSLAQQEPVKLLRHQF